MNRKGEERREMESNHRGREMRSFGRPRTAVKHPRERNAMKSFINRGFPVKEYDVEKRLLRSAVKNPLVSEWKEMMSFINSKVPMKGYEVEKRMKASESDSTSSESDDGTGSAKRRRLMKYRKIKNCDPKSANMYSQDLGDFGGFYFRKLPGPIRVINGIYRVNPEELELKKIMLSATVFAVSEHNKAKNTELKPVRLLRANRAMSSGTLCFLTFELSDSKVYEAMVRYNTVRIDASDKNEVEFMREALYYPAQPDSYTRHEFTPEEVLYESDDVLKERYLQEIRKYEGFYVSDWECSFVSEETMRISNDSDSESLHKGAKSATKFAVSQHNKSKNTMLKPVKLLRANLVNSPLFCTFKLTFNLSDGKVKEAEVEVCYHGNGGVDYKLNRIRDALHYPAQSECYTNLEF